MILHYLLDAFNWPCRMEWVKGAAWLIKIELRRTGLTVSLNVCANEMPLMVYHLASFFSGPWNKVFKLKAYFSLNKYII